MSKYVLDDGEVNQQAVAYELLTLLQAYAPNGEAQDICSRMYNSLIKSGMAWYMIVSTMLGSLSDGLRYGNWPWTDYGVATNER